MKLARWSFNGMNVQMIENNEGELFTTTNQIATALGIESAAVRLMYMNHKDEMDGLNISQAYAKDFLIEHKEILGIDRVRKDMKIWSEDEMITFAILSKSQVGKQFRSEFRKFVKQHRHIQYEELKVDHASLQDEYNDLSERFQRFSVRMAKQTAAIEKATRHVSTEMSHLKLVVSN